jgi:esterase/lipase superfamily enzyme
MAPIFIRSRGRSASGAPKLQIFAHSLGTGLTVNALRRIFDSPQRDVLRRISQLVLAAPDIDRVWMYLELVSVLEKFRIPTTVYVTEKDGWIGLSDSAYVASYELAPARFVPTLTFLGVCRERIIYRH